ncbi:neprilysin-11-like [Aphidius gifuensis]|uniref:neprilysin-11-like n=1 Tax=Aphidius gifuensis TaxID=684658 RepID=UPI001CDBA596|nr:neprilysin-11-like [Aphidius gifuensis]
MQKKLSNLIATVVNAYYDYLENSLSIPAVILQRPFYSKEQPDAVNYGGIGGVIGHEISHGFDDIGRRYDNNGNLKNWWSNNTLNDYKKRAWCLVEKFKKYAIVSQNTTYKLNSIKTLSENIADSTGIRAVFKAFEKHSVEKYSSNNMRLIGLENINTRKLFFLSYAHSFCEAMPLNKMLNMLMTDVHSPAPFRMTGTLSNMKEFSDVFECSNKTIMNPQTKCGLWY